MNKLRALLVASALLTAACGAATISGSQVKSVSNSGNVRVDAGANAGADVSASGADFSDLGRTNPTVRKGPSGPVPVQQSHAPTPAGTEPSTTAHDRCNGGIGTDLAGSRAGIPGLGHKVPLPECAVE